ncbi:SWIM zinc finger family protein [Haladaptatus halobius]|uniref:SWIM zinc finger family protein n=1 Tax=Haladaptatus halobius TaxID=2884875 RepID=UPI001D0B5259|nr:SWIM zinc finger family protein [Haladaptatus halobius]
MSTKPSPGLEADETAQKRAQWEQFWFPVEAPEMVDVTNESHDTPTDHQYVVTLDDVSGDVMACTCPHHVHRSAFYKHMAAVETATDDGTLTAFPSEEDENTDETDEDDAEPAECDCDSLNGFPCWECVRTGRTELPN